MRRRRLFVACCLVLSAVSSSAQSRGAKPDPLTGTWTGVLNVANAPGPVTITMALKFDGKSAVSGTFSGLPSPGDVKAGTFNQKTGAVRLELGKKGSNAVLIILEGTVAKGTASGRVSGEEGPGDFKIAKKE
jgi:hypothetical protein